MTWYVVLHRAKRLYATATPVVALLMAAASPVCAQQGVGSLFGTVTDEAGRALAGAQARVTGDAGMASTGRDGVYRLGQVGAGSRAIVVRYIGYQAETLTVNVVPGRSTRADLTMHHSVQQLTTMRVEGQVAGQAAALNQQRAADNIASVVDAELVGRLPDQNLAEAVARVPGVALVRDQGEGRFVQIRGIDANLNTLSIDGMRVPSPTPGTRSTPMDVIPSDMIAAVQVSKTLTPDMDADAIGGNVNLTTRTARAGSPLFSVNAAGGQNKVNNGNIKNVTAYAGNRFGAADQLGVVFGGNYYENNRGSQNFEQGWCIETTCKGVPAANALDVPSQLALRDYSQVKRTRKGFNGTLDYTFDENNTVFLKGLFSKFSDDEQRYVTLVNFAQGTYTLSGDNTGTSVAGRMDKELRLRPVSQSQRSAQLGGKHELSGTSLDYAAQVARATEDRPGTLTMLFRQSGMDFTYDIADPDHPLYSVTKGAEFDASKYTYNSLRQQTRHVLDDDKSGRINVSRPIALGSVLANIKVGGALRLKDRSSVDTSNRFLATFKAGMPAPTTPLTLSAVLGKPAGGIISNRFELGPRANANGVSSLWNFYGASLSQDVPRSILESNQGSFTVGEDVYAGYVMATLDVGPLRIIPGVRLETTKLTNTGNLVKQTGTNVVVTPQTRTSDYTNAFPSITARWSVDEQTTLRAAVTKSLVRPAYSDMAPFVTIPDGSSGVVATIGNPDLRPTNALNFDVMAERYFRTVGFVSLGVFRKELHDFIFPLQRTATASDNLGSTVAVIAQPVNGVEGTLNGFEVAWQQNLTFLPGAFSGLGVNANYTLTSSSTTLPSREGTTSRLPGQAGNAANLGVFYEYLRLSLRAGYNFSDSYLEVVGASALTDISVASRGQLDVSGSYRVTPQASVFVETNNLTNQPLRRFIGKSDRGWQPSGEFYRSWGMIGMRVQL